MLVKQYRLIRLFSSHLQSGRRRSHISDLELKFGYCRIIIRSASGIQSQSLWLSQPAPSNKNCPEDFPYKDSWEYMDLPTDLSIHWTLLWNFVFWREQTMSPGYLRGSWRTQSTLCGWKQPWLHQNSIWWPIAHQPSYPSFYHSFVSTNYIGLTGRLIVKFPCRHCK